MTDLRKAINQGKLDQFIAQRDGEIGDREAFERVIRSLAEISKDDPERSPGEDESAEWRRTGIGCDGLKYCCAQHDKKLWSFAFRIGHDVRRLRRNRHRPWF